MCRVSVRRKTQFTPSGIVCGREMDHVFEEKDLGVIIDSGLTFNDHILTKVQKANVMVGLIQRTFSYLDQQTFLKLYTVLVRPHLEYAVSVWSHLEKHINAIENVQIRATKLVDGFGNLTYQERLEKLQLTTLVYRRLRRDATEMYKHFHRYNKKVLPPSFIPKLRPSRQHQFQIQELNKKDGERGIQSNFLYHRIARTWNELLADVVQAENINTFKNRFDAHMKNHPIEFNHRAQANDVEDEE